MSNPTHPMRVNKQKPLDPVSGSSHPVPRPAGGKKKTTNDLGPALHWMRGEMVREFVRRMRQRLRSEGNTVGGRMRKRKAALAMSAAIMTVSTGAIEAGAPIVDKSAAEWQIDATQMRVDAKLLSASDTMKEALAEEEGVRLTVYRDVAGYPTVGVGHLVTPEDNLSVGDRITYDQALDLLEKDLQTAEAAVARLVGDMPVYQHEFDALVDLVYNVGEGNVSERESPKLNAAIAKRDYKSIAAQLKYHHAAGSKANGLVYRSERRQAIFMEAAYDDPRPASISVSGQVTS